MKIRAYGRKIGYRQAQGSLLSGVKKLWLIFDARERRSMLALLFSIIVLAFVEMAGVGSLVPFLTVAANPQVVQSNALLASVKDFLGIEDPKMFLAFLGVAVAVIIVLQNAFHALVAVNKSRFSNRVGNNMSCRLFGHYLAKPYVFYLNENTSNLSKNVLNEAQLVVTGYLTPLLESITDIIVGIGIILVLIAVNPAAAFVGAGAIVVIYGGIFLGVKRILTRLGMKRMDANRARFKAAMEALTGIKDVKLLGKEGFFMDRFLKPSRKMVSATIRIDVIGKMPNYVLLAVLYSGIVLGATALLVFSSNFSKYIPVIGVYAMGASKLMPRFKELFAHISKMRAYQAVVELMLENLKDERNVPLLGKSFLDVAPIPFEKSIELRGISFTYPASPEPVIRDQTLSIKSNTTVGIVGATGCGKTTLVDIILGLLRPQQGEILVDGVPVTDANLREWQANLGYVPQNIYLCDDSITANIAFGVPSDRIDTAAVKRAAEVANLAHFIETDLAEGYDASVKERGLRLSGGQKQRLGIARALYSDPSVLVLDEATSALDGVTESVIMEAIDKLGGKKTIVIIAHRLTTLMGADVIYLMDKGRIVAQGTYKELMETNEQFKRMGRVEG
jgi:ABC-type bacteriocin/lantibiotic exporter with double-glycine peptidase domain